MDPWMSQGPAGNSWHMQRRGKAKKGLLTWTGNVRASKKGWWKLVARKSAKLISQPGIKAEGARSAYISPRKSCCHRREAMDGGMSHGCNNKDYVFSSCFQSPMGFSHWQNLLEATDKGVHGMQSIEVMAWSGESRNWTSREYLAAFLRPCLEEASKCALTVDLLSHWHLGVDGSKS